MTSPKTAQVIGGGIIGLNVALALQGRGLDVVIVDAEAETPSASWGNAGHIATEQVEPLASWSSVKSLPLRLFSMGGAAGFPASAVGTWLPFGVRLIGAARAARFAKGKAALTALLAEALPAWRRCVASLNKAELLKEEGHFIIWESQASAAKGRAAWQRAETGTASWRNATSEEIARLRSRFDCPIAGAIRFSGSASISDPTDLLDSLRAHFSTKGGSFEYRKASSGDSALGELTVVCAGCASGSLMERFGHRVPIIAERGYHLQTPHQSRGVSLPPVVFADRSMVVTPFRSALRATSFVEFARSSDPPDPRKWAKLLAHAKAVGLPFGGQPSQWMGSRPTLPDYLPAIGKSDRTPNLIYAFGHQHLGLTTGPITGELVTALAMGERPPIDTAPFSLSRFERGWL